MIGLAAAAASVAVGVGLDEFRLEAYRTRVPAGSVRFNVTNLGEDVHDFVVRSPGGRDRGALGRMEAGERRTLRMKLTRPGVWRLVCTVADHEVRGMVARLRVTRRR